MEWNIQSRAHACQSCAQGFVDRQVYHTVLVDERSEYRRLDLCPACWSTRSAEASGQQGFVSHWQGLYEVPTPQPELIRKETAETLLRKLVEQNDPSHAAAQFILAVMLERKRVLKVREQVRREGRRWFIYEQPRTGDLFTVGDPELNLSQLDAVQQDVARLLEHGLEPPAPAADAPAPPTEGPPGEDPAAAPPATPESPPAPPTAATP